MPAAARFLEVAVQTYGIAPGPPEVQALALAQRGLWPETWDDGATWHEQGDPKKAVPAALVDAVLAAKAAVEAQNIAMFGTAAPDSDEAAEYSHGLAVTIEYLVAFTNEHDCWEWALPPPPPPAPSLASPRALRRPLPSRAAVPPSPPPGGPRGEWCVTLSSP